MRFRLFTDVADSCSTVVCPLDGAENHNICTIDYIDEEAMGSRVIVVIIHLLTCVAVKIVYSPIL